MMWEAWLGFIALRLSLHGVYGRVIYEAVFKDRHTGGFLFLIEKKADSREFQHFAIGDERFPNTTIGTRQSSKAAPAGRMAR